MAKLVGELLDTFDISLKDINYVVFTDGAPNIVAMAKNTLDLMPSVNR